MAPNPSKFGRLLAKAVRRISLEEDKLIGALQEELGYAVGRAGGSALDYWRSGKIPSPPEIVALLAREILKRADLGRPWLIDFLTSADYPGTQDLVAKLYPASLVSEKGASLAHLPVKPYRHFVGRSNLQEQLMQVLSDPDGHWMVAIDGMGGIGKSALAREVSHLAIRHDAFFENVAWVSAVPTESGHTMTFEATLDAIANQLTLPEIARFPLDEKVARLKAILQRQRVLIVLDNLDTALEPQDQIAQKLQPMLGYSKALLTSRRRFRSAFYSIHLTGLDEKSGRNFLLQEANDRNIRRVTTAKSGDLAQIVASTGGSPLAMKLIVGQLRHLQLDVALEHLHKASPIEREITQDEYFKFYRFIFSPSWELLSINGKKLLLGMSIFAPEIGGTLQAVQGTSRLPEAILRSSIDELWCLSFLEIGDSLGVEEIRYYLHSLTQYFVRSDIMKMPSKKET